MKFGESLTENLINDRSLLTIDSSLVAIAHELKSPLALIRQLSLFLESNTVELSQQQQLLKQITLTSERGLRLAADISRASRLDQLELNIEPLSPTEICHQVVKDLDLSSTNTNQRIVIRTRYRQNYLAIADYQLLKSVLIHFCDNALNYSGSDRPIELSISKLKKCHKIRISIRDFGPRLPLSVWRSFKSRQPIKPQALSSRPLSSGLGLYISSKFASLMNAELGAISHSDGATFYIELDISKQMSLI